jgi:hypothetical protein
MEREKQEKLKLYLADLKAQERNLKDLRSMLSTKYLMTNTQEK